MKFVSGLCQNQTEADQSLRLYKFDKCISYD